MELFWRRCSLAAVTILLVLVMFRTGAALVHNYRLTNGFTPATPPSPYQQGIPVDEMDLSVYSAYLPKAYALPYYPWTSRLATPVTIRYYDEIPGHGTAPALEIRKGTAIVALPEDGPPFHKAGYGLNSYPSHVKGWRYVRPFQPVNGAHSPAFEQYYYVRIEDLNAVMGEVIKANQPLRVEAKRQVLSLQSFRHRSVTRMDTFLYRNGVYLSPDLLLHPFDRWNVIMTAAAGAMVLLKAMVRGTRPSGRHFDA